MQPNLCRVYTVGWTLDDKVWTDCSSSRMSLGVFNKLLCAHSKTQTSLIWREDRDVQVAIHPSIHPQRLKNPSVELNYLTWRIPCRIF